MLRIVLVLAGGALGTGFRYFLSSFIYSTVKEPTFPYANLLINVSGSFLIGLLAEWVGDGLITLENVRVVQYRSGK